MDSPKPTPKTPPDPNAIKLTNIQTTNAAGYDVVISSSGGLCSEAYSSIAALTVNSTPVITGEADVCIGSTINLSPSTDGTWTSSDGTKATINNAGLVTGVAAGSVTFTYTETATGCKATSSLVTVNTTPAAPAASAYRLRPDRLPGSHRACPGCCGSGY